MMGQSLTWEPLVEDGWYVSQISPIAHRFRSEPSGLYWVSVCSLKRRPADLLFVAPANALRCKMCACTDYHDYVA